MNAPLRRAGVVVLILFGLLFVNLNWVQGYKAQSYRTDPHNARVQLSEYQRQRGTIALSGGQVIAAQSVPTDDELKYQRQYPLGAPYAPFVGYRPVSGLPTGVERAENDFLSAGGSSLMANWLLVGLLLRISDAARRPVASSTTPAGQPVKLAGLTTEIVR